MRAPDPLREFTVRAARFIPVRAGPSLQDPAGWERAMLAPGPLGKLSPRGCLLALSDVGRYPNNSKPVQSSAKGESEGCRGWLAPALTQGRWVAWDEARAGDGERMSHPNTQEGKERRQRRLSPRQQPDQGFASCRAALPDFGRGAGWCPGVTAQGQGPEPSAARTPRAGQTCGCRRNIH